MLDYSVYVSYYDNFKSLQRFSNNHGHIIKIININIINNHDRYISKQYVITYKVYPKWIQKIRKFFKKAV